MNVLEGPAVGHLPRTALSVRPGPPDLRKLTLCSTTAAVLNLWAATPLGVRQPFHRDLLGPWENTDIYVMTRNSSNITVMA